MIGRVGCLATFFLMIQLGYTQTNAAWTVIFSGVDLVGWSKVGGEGRFSLQDGNLKMQMKANTTEHTYLHTKKKYRNFILELDVKRELGFNYGVLFRAITTSDTAHARLHGYQVKADHLDTRRWTGGVFDDFGNHWNWLYDLSEDPRAQQAAHPPGSWDHLRIEAIANQIKIWVNEIPTAYLINDKYKKGFIAFKIHFLGNDRDKEEAAGYIRNVRIISKGVKRWLKEMDLEARRVE